MQIGQSMTARTTKGNARTVHEVVLADIQRHAGQALADRKAMVTEIAERLNVQLSADREQQKKELRQYKQRVSEIENLYAFIPSFFNMATSSLYL